MHKERPDPCILCDDVHAAGEVIFENEAGLILLHPDMPIGDALILSSAFLVVTSTIANGL